MSNLNSTVSVPALVSGSDTVSDVTFTFDSAVPEKALDGVKTQDFGVYAMREIVKGLRATERGNRYNVILHVGQVIETVARNMRDAAAKGEDFIGQIKGDKPVPPGIESSLKAAFREVCVFMVKCGDAPYLNCNVSVARIKAMKRDTAQTRKLWDYQARKLVDSTLFLNGQAVEKPKGKYLPESLRGAKSKELVESLKILRNYTNKIIAWLWATSPETFRYYAFRDEAGAEFTAMSQEDIDSIERVIAEKGGSTMSDLAAAFRKESAAGEEKSAVERLLESFKKLDETERANFLSLAQTAHTALIDAALNAAKAVNGADADDVYDLDVAA